MDAQMNLIRESLLCRFIINLPKEELTPDRIFVHLQSANWYYMDLIVPTLKFTPPNMTEIQFYQWLIQPIHSLKSLSGDLARYHKKYRTYSKTIPLNGGILLNEKMDSILLVMNFSLTVYSFPKGKINQGENEQECAVREVWEEVGYDIGKKIKEGDFVQLVCENTSQVQRMYVIQGVEEHFNFQTNTRNEIGKIVWVQIKEIMDPINRNKYASVYSFMVGLQQFITRVQLFSQTYKKPYVEPSKEGVVSQKLQYEDLFLTKQDILCQRNEEQITKQSFNQKISLFECQIKREIELTLDLFRNQLRTLPKHDNLLRGVIINI